MKKTTHNFRRTVLAATMLSAFGPVLAQDAEMAQLIRPESSVSIGAGVWSRDRPQQGIYDDMRDGPTVGLVDLDIVKRDEASGTWISISGRKLGLNTRSLRGEYLRQGDIGAAIEYSRTPRDNPFNINTGLQGIGSEQQTVINIAPGTGANVELGTRRDGTGLRFYKNLMPGLDFNISFKNEDKDGTRHWGRGGAAEFAVEPIDSTTRQLEAKLDYTSERWQLSGGYYGSWYDNKNSLVTSVGAATYFLSLPLDNQSHQLFLDGGYNFTPTTRGTFKLSYARATQDEHLPTQDLPGLSLAGSPQNLDGRLDTTLLQLGVTSRPMKDLSVMADLRYHDLKDKTPEARFVQGTGAGACVTANPAGNQTCVENTPFSFKTITGKAEATYRLADGYSVTGGLEHREQDRHWPTGEIGNTGVDVQRVVPLRSDIEETSLRLELRRSLSETLNGSLAYSRSDRDGSAYSGAGAGPGGAPSDFINPIHIADRKRDKWRLGLDWAPIENLSLQFAYENSQDDYETSSSRPFGLIDGEAELYTIDASYAVSDDWNVTAWVARDDTEATQRNGTSLTVPASMWTDRLRDKGDSLGFGLRGKPLSALSVGADYQWTRNRSEYPQTTDAGTRNNLPNIENRLARLSLFAEYALRQDADLRFDWVHERWRTDDWTWRFANGAPFTYGSVTDGTTVTQDEHQTSNFVGARYIYRFR